MGTFTSPKVESGMKLEDLANLVAMLIEEMDYLLNGQIDAKNVRAKSITAEKLKVNELSAISANLGKVVAGILIGAYISTADGTYPRIDFTSEENLLKAYKDLDTYITLRPGITGDPGFYFKSNNLEALMSMLGDTLLFQTFLGNIQIQSNKSLILKSGSGYFVRLDAWSRLLNVTSGRTLQQDFDFQEALINNLLGRVSSLESRVTALENRP